jgi:hypothetical protein
VCWGAIPYGENVESATAPRLSSSVLTSTPPVCFGNIVIQTDPARGGSSGPREGMTTGRWKRDGTHGSRDAPRRHDLPRCARSPDPNPRGEHRPERARSFFHELSGGPGRISCDSADHRRAFRGPPIRVPPGRAMARDRPRDAPPRGGPRADRLPLHNDRPPGH